MSERKVEQEQITGEIMLFHLRRIFQMDKDVAAQINQIEEAGKPIRTAMGEMATMDSMKGGYFSFESLSPSVKEAIAIRTKMQAYLDYQRALLGVVSEDVKQRLFEALRPEGQNGAQIIVKNYAPDNLALRPQIDSGAERPKEISGVFGGIGPKGRFYVLAEREYYEVRPFSDDSGLQINIDIVYTE